MANLQGYELTVTGRALLAKAGTGACTLNFTKVKLGADETSLNDLINKTDLVGTNIKQIDIVGSKANEATFTIIATVTNSGMQNNFLIRQVGIFAKGVAATNPGTGVTPEDINETLFAVAYDTQPDIIPAESITPYTRQFNANMTVTNVEQCNVTLTPSGVVTVQVLNNHNDNSEAHGNLIKRIFGSASATMDSIKNKINEWSKEVCLPLSGGELIGDITANNVYANNNVLVFNNVEEMKASNKVKAGYTLKTLGFYQPNDGGAADYVIIGNLGKNEVDEASIIALSNGLYAKLLIKDFINVKQWGAYGDGIHDDIQALQKAIDYKEVKLKYFPNGVYCVSDTLYTDAEHKCQLQLNSSEIKAIGSGLNSKYIIELGGKGTGLNYGQSSERCEIFGGIVNANSLAYGGIRISNMHFGSVHHMSIIKCNMNPLCIDVPVDSTSADAYIREVYLSGTSQVGSIALDIKSNDNNIAYVRTAGCYTGIKLSKGGNVLTECHP